MTDVGRLSMLLVAAVTLLPAAPAAAQKFYPDDPLLVDRDDVVDIPPPAEIELSGGWDMIENTFGIGTPPAEPGPLAANVNTLGEVWAVRPKISRCFPVSQSRLVWHMNSWFMGLRPSADTIPVLKLVIHKSSGIVGSSRNIVC